MLGPAVTHQQAGTRTQSWSKHKVDMSSSQFGFVTGGSGMAHRLATGDMGGERGQGDVSFFTLRSHAKNLRQ